jgi:urease accessory protein
MFTTLLQWGDSAYPTGGFAYSSGLEAMARWPAFTTLDHLREYLVLVLEQAFMADLPYLVAMHAAAKRGEEKTLADLVWEWDAFQHQPTLRRASLAQGEAWMRLYRDSHPEASLKERDTTGTHQPLHFIAALASTAAAEGLLEAELRELYLHLVLRDQVAAAVRLGLLGANQAQSLQTQVAKQTCQRWRERQVSLPEDAVRCAPVLETVQALHPHMYVRLFQN